MCVVRFEERSEISIDVRDAVVFVQYSNLFVCLFVERLCPLRSGSVAEKDSAPCRAMRMHRAGVVQKERAGIVLGRIVQHRQLA